MTRKIFYNGKVLTQDSELPEATAFIVEDGIFTQVGNDEAMLALSSDADELINLHNQFVIPGFNDAHIHIWKVGNLITHMLDLRGVKSIAEMQHKILAYANQNPNLSWIQARGFNEVDFDVPKMPNKLDLDILNLDRPICVTRTCAHQIIVNTKALEIAEINVDTISPNGGEIKYLEDDTLAGHFTETAIGLILRVIPKYTHAELREMVLAAQKQFLTMGITAATDPAVDRDLLEVYKQMDKAGELKIRINAIPIRVPDGALKAYPNPDKYASQHLIVNTVKFFADGGLSGKTAALFHPYKNTNNHGVLRLDEDTFLALAQSSQAAGFRIATHAIGDAAIEMVLNVYDKIAAENVNLINHRIEHLGLPSMEHLAKMQRLNISAVMQPVFISELGNNFINYLNADYLSNLYPVRSVIDSGVLLALSTDAPVVKQYNPIACVMAAMSRKTNSGILIGENQHITLNEALYAYTMGSAIAGGQDNWIGSITKGKFADFLTLTALPGTEPIELETYIEGHLMN